MIFSLRVQHSCFVSHLCKKRFNAISASFPGDLRLVLIKRIPPSLLHPSFNSPSRPDRPSPAPYSRHFLAVPPFELQQSVCAALNFIYLELRKPPIWVARANFHTVFVCKAIVARLQCARQTIYARWQQDHSIYKASKYPADSWLAIHLLRIALCRSFIRVTSDASGMGN